ncbi:hypothetical protein UA08_01359 [Talaromyces atroroseus]|uniref:Uncharacterized protein n=1 Tax=Talaromyces atroroseus TaxID=1441469 RepID=A0A1Q5QB58_TALAT|nr:hypothetical protein UA08_01359 [Talaromyces atroroseus]OKL63156.1 hypothetical protein UA08_01359 [Talaromyces atroroseus]
MLSHFGIRAWQKRPRSGKSKSNDDLRKVTIVGSLHDVRLPPANDAVKQSLLNSQYAGRAKRRTASDLDQSYIKRFSQSETALHHLQPHKSTSDELLGLSKSATTDPMIPQGSERIVSSVLAHNNDLKSSNSSPSISPLSPETRKMGTSYGIEEYLSQTKSYNNPEDLSETSVSSSSSTELWDPRPRYCSSASSNSSLRSDASFEESQLPETKPIRPLNTCSNPDLKNVDCSHRKDSSQSEAQRTTGSRDIKMKNKEQHVKQKPLPAVPSTLNVSKKHISELTSKYSTSPVESSADRLIMSKAADKTLSEATHDLERELDMLVDTQRSRPISPANDENSVAPLKVTPKPDRNGSRFVASMQQTSKTTQPQSRPTPKQHPTYKVFPPASKNSYLNKEKINTFQHAQYTPRPLADVGLAKNSIKQSLQASPSKNFVSRKIRSSVHLPSLRRPKINTQSTQSKNENTSEPLRKSPVVSLRDEQAALARSTDRYIDAEIAKALNADHDEDNEDSESNNKAGEEGEWSTIYPLKAVKKLGIPLMTSSHIPQLSYAESERALRQQLPKLDTNSLLSAIERQELPLQPAMTDRTYPETPDDLLQLRSFKMDSTPAPTLPEEKEPVKNDKRLDSDKIFIRFDRIETVPKDLSPKLPNSPNTQEVPLMMSFSSPSAMYHPRTRSTIYELAEHGSTPISPSPKPIGNFRLPMPSHMTDKVVLALMMSVNNLDGLFNYAQVSRQFYRVFKKNELSLIKNALFNMNPPAWELREMSPPWSEDPSGMKDPDAPVPQYTPSSYLRHYARDIFVLAKLKTLIFARCGSFMRPETIRGLTGEDDARASEIDEAFWRIWTFCRIFGCGKNREGDMNGQIDWLNAGFLAKRSKAGVTVITAEPLFSANNVLFDPPAGFGMGNADGLTCRQLYDMTEIWNCLGTLVQVFHHECKEARVAGIFDGLDIAVGDIAKEGLMLEEWTHYLLTLGPSALVGLSSVYPNSSIKEQFAKAKQMGVTKWEAPEDGGTRSSFLREAISRIYERRVAAKPKETAPQTTNVECPNGLTATNQNDNNNNNAHSIYGEQPQGHSLDGGSSHLVPPYNSTMIENISSAMSSPPPRYSSTFLDPVDKAIHKIVHDLGFSEHDAKWALKITDTGDMLDTNAAIRLLLRERDKRAISSMEDRSDSLVDASKHRGTVAWQWA